MMNFLKKSKLDIIILQLGVSLLFFLLYSGFNYEILYFENFSWFLKPSITNDIEIFDSSIKIIKSKGNDIEINSGKSKLNNYKQLIRVYNNVFISILDKNKTLIKTNSFDWELNSSDINFNRPLYIDSENTKIISSLQI